MSQFLETVAQYRTLMEKGAFLQVIDQYYHENIKQKENTEPPVFRNGTP